MTQSHSASATLVKRYVTALLDAAVEVGATPDIATAARALTSTIAGAPDLQKLLSSPLLSVKDQTRATGAVLERMRVHPLMTGFVHVVLQNRRGPVLQALLQATLDEIARRDGRIEADVQVAAPMNDIQQKKLADALSKWSGGKVQLNMKVMPEVLGGMKIRVGSMQIDDSVVGKLDRLKQNLLGAKTRA